MFRAAARSPRAFLTAQWRHLPMLNFEVDQAILEPYLPRGLELDSWNGKHYVSLVGFMFLDARLLGIRIPFHGRFPEVNLRFYVRRPGTIEDRRGVVFIRELVPKWCVSFVAGRVYHESFLTVPMRYRIADASDAAAPTTVEYDWRFGGRWNRLHVEAAGAWRRPEAGSLEEFVVEHYWGYTRQPDGGCLEYSVAHPPWSIRCVTHAELDCDAVALYGPALGAALSRPAESAFLADGSGVSVRKAHALETRVAEFARIPTT
jgi:uncharacterized protein YqjF (DUF2071 family)